MPLFVLLTFLGLGLVGLFVLVVNPLLLWMYQRHLKRQQKGLEWQLTKMEKFCEGWRPVLWDEDATDDQKLEAIIRYARGEFPDR